MGLTDLLPCRARYAVRMMEEAAGAASRHPISTRVPDNHHPPITAISDERQTESSLISSAVLSLVKEAVGSH